MTFEHFTEDALRTAAAKMFDLESVSVTVRRFPETKQLGLVIRDEKTGASRDLKFNLDVTEDQVKRLIAYEAEQMGLVAAPSRHEDPTQQD